MIKRRIVFLDRDGTIIRDKCYMHRPEDLEFIDGSIDALRRLQATHALVVVTNQSGIGRGRFSKEDYERFNIHFLHSMEKAGVDIEATLHCPHGPDENCACRKPSPRLVRDWLEEQGIELDKNESYMVGDKMSDVELGKNLGIKGILISKKNQAKCVGYHVVESLNQALEVILC